MDWHVLEFKQLSTLQLYALLQLRAEIFVVEQNCAYQDIDGWDQNALHILGERQQELLCYARILGPGVRYAEPSIGRVINRLRERGNGLGRQLMQLALQECENKYPGMAIRISAQHYLEQFYASLGFSVVSEPYLEDGIPHVEMLKD